MPSNVLFVWLIITALEAEERKLSILWGGNEINVSHLSRVGWDLHFDVEKFPSFVLVFPSDVIVFQKWFLIERL